MDYLSGQVDMLRTLIADLQARLDSLTPKPEPPRRPAFAVDPAFTPEQITTEQKMWRDRLLATFGAEGVTYPSNNDNFAGTGAARERPTYSVGYQCIIEIYMQVIDATGDPAVFAEIIRLMNLINEARIVYTSDLEESYVTRLYAVYALLLEINQHPDAAAWRKRLLVRIANRGGLVGNNDLAQCIINNLLTVQCLWRLTRSEVWRERALGLKQEFFSRMVIDVEQGIWLHSARNPVWLGDPARRIWRLPQDVPTGFPVEPMGAQWADYFRYDLSALLILDKLGCTVFAPELLVARVRDMYRAPGDVSFRMDRTDLRNPQTGETFAWNKGDVGWVISSYPVLGVWDENVRTISLEAWQRVPEHEKMPLVPAAMLSSRREA